jgi:hypothetical protein
MLNGKYLCGFLIAVELLVAAGTNLEAALSINLTPSANSPAPVGTLVHWSTVVSDTGSGTLWYRFRAAEPIANTGANPRRNFGTNFHMIVDYGPINSLDWTEMDHEGTYLIEVSVQDKTTGETATTIAPFELTSRLGNGTAPVISSTKNPLVFLYSAPGCREGSRMLVQFQSPDGTTTATPAQACHRTSMNFYLAGMRSQTTYQVQHTLINGSASVLGPKLTVTTGSTTITPPSYNAYVPPMSASQGVLLQCGLTVPTLATDLLGNVIWYYDGPITIATRAIAGGYFLGISEDSTVDASHEYVVKFDLAGTTLRETNAARVSEQLAAMGRNPIAAFHHEARAIPGGGYLVLADTERILTDIQGPGPVDVIGDVILVLDSNLQVVWAWDAFDHLDTSRMAVLGETCPSGAGCAPYHLADTANDWLHGNSLQLAPDGQILYSSRHQDWLIKINYNNGLGDGAVIWRLGLDGDFQIVSSDPYPWFSHQHDANMQQTQTGFNVSLFDDGNTRVAANPDENSRGQVLMLDEQNHIATLILNADMGGYSYALGTAQLLPNGNYHFDAGWIAEDPVGGENASRSVEVDPAGNIVYGLAISAPEYRTFRMPDLYTPQDQ